MDVAATNGVGNTDNVILGFLTSGLIHNAHVCFCGAQASASGGEEIALQDLGTIVHPLRCQASHLGGIQDCLRVAAGDVEFAHLHVLYERGRLGR